MLTKELFYTHWTTRNLFIVHVINPCFLRCTLPLQRLNLFQLQNILIYLSDHKIYGKSFIGVLFSLSLINFSLQLRETNIKICFLVYILGQLHFSPILHKMCNRMCNFCSRNIIYNIIIILKENLMSTIDIFISQLILKPHNFMNTCLNLIKPTNNLVLNRNVCFHHLFHQEFVSFL